MMYKSQIQKMYPYDWFCGPWSQFIKKNNATLTKTSGLKGSVRFLQMHHLCDYYSATHFNLTLYILAPTWQRILSEREICDWRLVEEEERSCPLYNTLQISKRSEFVFDWICSVWLWFSALRMNRTKTTGKSGWFLSDPNTFVSREMIRENAPGIRCLIFHIYKLLLTITRHICSFVLLRGKLCIFKEMDNSLYLGL